MLRSHYPSAVSKSRIKAPKKSEYSGKSPKSKVATQFKKSSNASQMTQKTSISFIISTIILIIGPKVLVSLKKNKTLSQNIPTTKAKSQSKWKLPLSMSLTKWIITCYLMFRFRWSSTSLIKSCSYLMNHTSTPKKSPISIIVLKLKNL